MVNYATLIEHWDGTTWSLTTSPNSGTTVDNFLNGVACASPSECWAVGSYRKTSTVQQTLILRWNGLSWKVVASPNADTTHNNILHSVACASTSLCWAVGNYNNGTTDVVLVEKWNGTAWSTVNAPDLSSFTGNYLNGVACSSTSDCWAAGVYGDANGLSSSLMEHWNGTSWSVATTPVLRAEFQSITCAGASDCWAAGENFTGNVSQTLLEHWNGTTWSQVSAPSIAPVELHRLNGISCTASNDCWVAGFYTDINDGPDHSLIEHWDGTRWSLDPHSDLNAQLHGIACSSATQCWAVGLQFAGNGLNASLAENYFPPLSVETVGHLSAGDFIIHGQAAPGSSVTIEASPDLVSQFQSIGSASADSTGAFQFDDSASVSLQKRFYRASYP